MSASPETTTVGEGQLAAEVSHHFAELDECRMHYVSRGEGKPILFLHGFPQFWFLWRRQLGVIVPDAYVTCLADLVRGINADGARSVQGLIDLVNRRWDLARRLFPYPPVSLAPLPTKSDRRP